MKYILPEQWIEWKQDKQISFCRGLFLGIILCLIASVIIAQWYLGKEFYQLTQTHLYEIQQMNHKLLEQREELGVLHEAVYAAYGRNTKVIVEQFRRKVKKNEREEIK